MTTSEFETSSKVLATHRYRSAVVYVRQSTPWSGRAQHRVHRPAVSGFAELTTLVGLGQVGIVLALEVSRLARNNSDWYRPRTWPPTIRGYSTTRMPDVLVEPGALAPEQYLDVRVAGDPGPQRPLQRGLVDETARV